MRVTDRMGYEQVTRNLQKNRTDMSDLQNQAATQKRVTKPSDDPSSATRVLNARTNERGNTQFLKNINVARSFLEYSDQSLSELSETLMRLKELAIGQANDAGSSAETRRVAAEEVGQIFQQAIQIGNRKLGERYIFGGFKTTSLPFTGGGDYLGDDGDLNIQINKDSFVSMNLPGDQVFMGKGISADGALRPRMGVPKSSEQLHEFKETELEKQQREEELKEEPLQLRAPASSTARGQKGVETRSPETGEGGTNILQAIKDLEISMRVNDKAEIQAGIDSIDRALSQVIQARAQLGSRIQTLNHATDSLQKAVNDDKMTASQLEDADLFQVASDIARTDSTLKATLETSGKVVQPSLLDFLK